MLKAHIVISPDPLETGSTQFALCRAEITNFQWLAQLDPGVFTSTARIKELINPIYVCRICYAQDAWPDGYLYLAKSGEEAEVSEVTQGELK